MKKGLILLSTVAILLNAGNIPPVEPVKPVQAIQDNKSIAMEGVKYIKVLGKTLKSQLMKQLKADPTALQGAYFCSKNATLITNEVNAKFPSNIKVRRTALKYRNPANKPDETDIKVMKEIQSQIKAGDFKKKPIVVKVANGNRVYVPLIAKKACLKCHGVKSQINPKVKETIAKAYPKDLATGFKEGDLRGVVVAEIKDKK